jgi:nucleotide-binding universal stress UspA family protein
VNVRILVGIDGSQRSAPVVDAAAKLATDEHGELIIVYAVDWRPIAEEAEAAGGPITGTPIDPDALIQGLEAEGRTFLAQAAQRATHDGVAATHELYTGNPVDVLLTVARDERCASIVVGEGHVARELLHRASIPVHVVAH